VVEIRQYSLLCFDTNAHFSQFLRGKVMRD
jgi:hypothetical protein